MKRAAFVLTAVLLAGLSSPASAAEISRSLPVGVSVGSVWEVIGPFCAIAKWHPVVESCSEEVIDGATYRRLVTVDGAELLEKQLAHDDAITTYSYSIVESPLPVENYVSTLTVTDASGRTRITWQSTFAPKGVSEPDAVNVIAGIYDAGLLALKKRFGQ